MSDRMSETGARPEPRPYPGAVFERFTDRARNAFVAAHDEACLLGHTELASGHVLLGLLHDEGSDAGRCLGSLGVTLEAARARVQPDPDGGRAQRPRDTAPEAAGDAVVFTPAAKRVLERSLHEVLRLGGSRIGTGHVVLGLLDVRRGGAADALAALDVDLGTARRRAVETIALGVEAGERVPAPPVVVSELSPQARDALQSALRIGSAYLGRRYGPVRMLLRASNASGAMRRFTNGAVGPTPASPPADALHAGSPLPVPATCGSCGTTSPACGTLYTTAGGALVCEHCLGGAG
jgi:hypothetical protein